MTLDTFRNEIVWRLRNAKEQNYDSLEGKKSMKEVGYWNGYIQAMREVDILLAKVMADTKEEEK